MLTFDGQCAVWVLDDFHGPYAVEDVPVLVVALVRVIYHLVVHSDRAPRVDPQAARHKEASILLSGPAASSDGANHAVNATALSTTIGTVISATRNIVPPTSR